MTIGIYCIENTVNQKKYVGKSINMDRRIWEHKYLLRRDKHHNSYLQNSYNKYGKDCFKYYFLEELDSNDQIQLSFKEMEWIDRLGTIDKCLGYNLLYDSPMGHVFHEETLKKMSRTSRGVLNPNFGNHWADDQKRKMSEFTKERHESGKYYNDEWRTKMSKASSETWKDSDKKARMIKKLKESKNNSDFYQYTKDGELVSVWKDLAHILRAHPGWKWQNIYAACNGSKRSYHGFIWKRVEKSPAWKWYEVNGMFEDDSDDEEFEEIILANKKKIVDPLLTAE